MQIRLDPETVKMASQFIELCKKAMPAYSATMPKLVNWMMRDKLREEIERMKKKGVVLPSNDQAERQSVSAAPKPKGQTNET